MQTPANGTCNLQPMGHANSSQWDMQTPANGTCNLQPMRSYRPQVWGFNSTTHTCFLADSAIWNVEDNMCNLKKCMTNYSRSVLFPLVKVLAACLLPSHSIRHGSCQKGSCPVNKESALHQVSLWDCKWLVTLLEALCIWHCATEVNPPHCCLQHLSRKTWEPVTIIQCCLL